MLADCESNNSISFLVCGGFNEGYMSRSQLLTTSYPCGNPISVVPLSWQGNFDKLLKKDSFTQQQSFPVPSELLTAAFVRQHVRDETK